MKILFSGVQRTEVEKVYTVARNVDADSITTGMVARYVGGAPAEDVSADGVQVVKLTTADDPNMLYFCGIAAEDIPADGYGEFQNYGFVDNIMISHVGTSITIGTFGGINSTLLRPGARAGTMFSGGPVDFTSIVPVTPLYHRVFVWATTTPAISGDAPTVAGFIRNL